MSFESYYVTRDENAVSVYDKVMSERSAWQRACYDLVKSWGFEGYRANDFRAPSNFLKLIAAEDFSRKGPQIEGFKGGDRVYGGQAFFDYTLHGKHPLTKARSAELREFAEKHWQEELSDPFIRSAQSIICKRLAVMVERFSGDRITFSGIWKMRNGDLCISVPIPEKDGMWALPTIDPIWQEITTSQIVSHFNEHNQWARSEESAT